MSLKDFQIIAKLGEGAYSSVYKVKRIQDGQEYALKKVKMVDLSDKEKQNALNEVRILASIRHNGIIGYKEVFFTENLGSLCIIMEYSNQGDLYQKICELQKQSKLCKEQEIWSIFIQVVKGLKSLHDQKIFHRDLKSANIFLSENNVAKLGDMNVSKVAKRGMLYTQTGTPYYASPEVWKDQPYDQKSDIWSLGCVLYELTTLHPPFRAEDMEGLYNKVIKGYYPRIPSSYSQDLSNVIRALLQVNPQLRPNCDKILQFPSVIRNMKDEHCIEIDEVNPLLLQTIKVPKNLHYLTDKLPKPNYSPLKTKLIDKHKFLNTIAGNRDVEQLTKRNPLEIYSQANNIVGLPSLMSKKKLNDHEDSMIIKIAKIQQHEMSKKNNLLKQVEIQQKIKDAQDKNDKLIENIQNIYGVKQKRNKRNLQPIKKIVRDNSQYDMINNEQSQKKQILNLDNGLPPIRLKKEQSNAQKLNIYLQNQEQQSPVIRVHGSKKDLPSIVNKYQRQQSKNKLDNILNVKAIDKYN